VYHEHNLLHNPIYGATHRFFCSKNILNDKPDSQGERIMASMAVKEEAAERAEVLVRQVETVEGERQYEKSGL